MATTLCIHHWPTPPPPPRPAHQPPRAVRNRKCNLILHRAIASGHYFNLFSADPPQGWRGVLLLVVMVGVLGSVGVGVGGCGGLGWWVRWVVLGSLGLVLADAAGLAVEVVEVGLRLSPPRFRKQLNL